jgi:hypothetical protein
MLGAKSGADHIQFLQTSQRASHGAESLFKFKKIFYDSEFLNNFNNLM